TVKRLHADDSADTRVKVGNRQAPHAPNKNPTPKGGVFAFEARYLQIREVRAATRLAPHRRILPSAQLFTLARKNTV
ncbi:MULTISPECIES: hypothetical protein, partial [unclassified Caballeronia]|uniref:hypothetical protein n=1 Tax=unclassified Caballeronia TaxID=2646786 RepID=UPI002028DCA3